MPIDINKFLRDGEAFFELETTEMDLENEEDDGPGWNGNEKLSEYLNPCKESFEEMKTKMIEVFDGVWKKVVSPAEENARQVDLNQHRVNVRYNMYQENEPEPFDSNILTGKNVDIVLNSYQRPLQGFCDAVSSMREGEHSLFIVTYKKMFKELGCGERIRPKSDIFCDIEVVAISEIGDESELQRISSDVKNFADIKSSLGDALTCAKDYFKQNKFKDSVRVFESIRTRLQWTKTADENERAEKIEMLLKALLNIAICHLALDNHKKAMESLEIYEGINENADKNPKFLFNKGKALFMNGDYKESKSVLQQALTVQPGSTEIFNLLEKLRVREEEHAKKEKEMIKNMFK